MRLDETGILGLGTSAPAYKLHVVGDACVPGEIDVASHARLKMNITDLDHAINTVKKLAPKVYNLRDAEFPEMNLATVKTSGFSHMIFAQELEEVLPDLVSEGAEVVNAKNDETFNSKSVNYIQLIPLLTKAIQEQQDIIEHQQAEINAIKKQFVELK